MATDRISPEILDKLAPGTTIYTILRHVSQSGMVRDIDIFVMGDDGPIMVTYIAKELLNLRWGKRQGVRMHGSGMDMGFALVYDLSSVLNKTGFQCVGDGCPSNDHSNGDRDYTPHHHHDGGYALKHRWL